MAHSISSQFRCHVRKGQSALRSRMPKLVNWWEATGSRSKTSRENESQEVKKRKAEEPDEFRWVKRAKASRAKERRDKKLSTDDISPSILIGRNCRTWSELTTSALSILMEEAGYDTRARSSCLSFHAQQVVPYLGPCPTSDRPKQWRSFMTDDFSPLEYSWNWDGPPKIRYAFEPIDANAGTSTDIFNRRRPLQCADALRSVLKESDWRLFDTFVSSFYDHNLGPGQAHGRDPMLSSPSSIFLALELDKALAHMGKAYLIPVRALQASEPSLATVTESIRRISSSSSIPFPAYHPLHAFLTRQNPSFDLIGVAVDLVAPHNSKLKIYLRSGNTSFTSVRRVLTLDDTLSSLWPTNALSELRELWALVFGLSPSFSDDRSLPNPSSHETAGVLYNFDIKAHNSTPDTKIYIPVRHYGQNDRAIAEGLIQFLRRKGRAEHVSGFIKALDRLCRGYRELGEGRGLQTYVSCAAKGEKLSLTSYISAEVYHPGRWRGKSGK